MYETLELPLKLNEETCCPLMTVGKNDSVFYKVWPESKERLLGCQS